MLLNDKPYPNHILTTNTNPNPVPDNTKSLSNQPHTADDALVILATKTALSETQRNLLRKGLTFIPKPKNLTIQNLHKDVNNFKHRMKLKFEMELKKIKIPPKAHDPFQRKLKRTPNPERLTDNGTLDTYLHRIR